MDSKGIIYTSEEAKSKFKDDFEKEVVNIPQQELEQVVTMNRAQRRAWYRATRKRGRGFTK